MLRGRHKSGLLKAVVFPQILQHVFFDRPEINELPVGCTSICFTLANPDALLRQKTTPETYFNLIHTEHRAPSTTLLAFW